MKTNNLTPDIEKGLGARAPKIFVLGIFIGLAVIIPGVSGSAIAMILGLYTAMLYSLGNVFSDFKRCVRFLLPLLLGAIIGFGLGFVAIKILFEKFLFEIVCLFVGFMIGALPAITREIYGQALTPVRCTLFPIGFLIPIAVGVVSIALSDGGGSSESFTDFPAWLFIAYVPLGAAVSLTQIVPGLSATAILMALGQFSPILNSVSVSYIKANPEVLGLYAALIIGFAVGIILISKLFSMIIAKHKTTAFFMITGMSVGSIVSMFINPDMYSLYLEWSQGSSPIKQLILGALLIILGLVLSFLLTKKEVAQK